MQGMKCLGYYFVRPLPRPWWCTLEAENILSVSENGLSDKFPDLMKCVFTNYPKREHYEYARMLGLDEEEFVGFSRLAGDLFNWGELDSYSRFRSLESAEAMLPYLENIGSKIGPKIGMFRLVGLFTDEEIFREYKKDIQNADESRHFTAKKLGCEILGNGAVGDSGLAWDSYIINSLNEELDGLRVDSGTGLIVNDFGRVKEFSEMIRSMGEPVVWNAFKIYEYEKNE
ncbi:MAG: hypothetical protein K2N72_06645 [Oscillospiraceae bacterium]|nr:hypothetical protein [Oscillospiraceae bacterium]